MLGVTVQDMRIFLWRKRTLVEGERNVFVTCFCFYLSDRSCHVTRLVSESLSCPGFQQCWGLQVCSTTPGLEWLALVLILTKFLCDECGILDDNSVKMRVTSWGSVGVNWGLLWATFKWVSCFRWVDIGLDRLQGSVLQLHYLCEIWVFPSASLLPSLYFFLKWEECGRDHFLWAHYLRDWSLKMCVHTVGLWFPLNNLLIADATPTVSVHCLIYSSQPSFGEGETIYSCLHFTEKTEVLRG